MKALFAILMITASLTVFGAQDDRCYEMRVYYAAEGKFEDLHARFRNVTMKLFEKHGMVNVGYWTPIDNSENKLIYVLSYPSKEARAKAWKEFGADPEWKAAAKASEANGRLVAKAESTLLQCTDYSPAMTPSKAGEQRVFELRTYKTPPGKLPDLNKRFRDHTLKLFSKHGMTHIGYWQPIEARKGADDTLIYILAHKSKEAAENSFKAFRADTDWIAAKKASEENGSLTTKVESVLMVPTDYSPLK